MNGTSTWISDPVTKWIGAGAVLLALTGCLGKDKPADVERADLPAVTQDQSDPTREASFLNKAFGGGLFQQKRLEHVSVARGSVVLAPPAGYCIDPKASSSGSDVSFVVMAGCDRVLGDGHAVPSRTALLTVSVSAGPGPSPEGYARFVSQSEGRAALSRSGNSEDFTVVLSETSDEVFLLYANDSSADRPEGLSTSNWRAFFDLNGQIVALTAYGLEASPLSIDGGLGLLRSTVASIKAASPQPEPAQIPETVIAQPATTTSPAVSRSAAFAE